MSEYETVGDSDIIRVFAVYAWPDTQILSPFISAKRTVSRAPVFRSPVLCHHILTGFEGVSKEGYFFLLIHFGPNIAGAIGL